MSLSRAIEMLTVGPSKIVSIPKGTLSEGADADVAIFDIQTEKEVDVKKFKSKGKNSPFNGWRLKGWAVTTIVGGEIKYQQE